MKNKYTSLILFELRRIWGKTLIITISIAIAIIWLIIFSILKSGLIGKEGAFVEINIHSILNGIFSFSVPLLVIFFTSGIISNDLKNHWLKTILMSPITRESYLLTRMAVVLISIWLILILAFSMPLYIIPLFSSNSIKIDFNKLILLHTFYFLISVTYISIAIWLSCWVSGFFNVFLFALWMILDSIMNPLISTFFWDNKILLFIADFFYPSGFKETLEYLLSDKLFRMENFIWGMAAMFGFMSLCFFHFSKINIDKGSE